MSVESSDQRSQTRHFLSLVALVCVSLLLIAGLVYWHFLEEMAAGNLPKELRFYEGSLKDGELWYRVIRFSGNPLAPKQTTRLKRLNLETGEDRDTDFVFPENHVLPVWIGDTLFVYSYKAIYQVKGESLIKLEPAPFSCCLSVPFQYDGHLTVAYDTRNVDDGLRASVRLAHWIDGKWIVGRQILLPSMEQYWYDDPERGCKVLLARTSAFTGIKISACTTYYFPYNLIVAQHHQRQHLLMTGMSCMQAEYRRDFEFDDEPTECPCALAPENAPHDGSGWEPILADRADDDWVQMSCDRDGLLFASSNTPRRLVRQQADGQRVECNGDALRGIERNQFIWIAADPSATTSYVILSDQFWGSATICRIEGNIVLPPHVVVPGDRQAYVMRWGRICIRLLSVWLFPMAVLFGGACWLTRRSTDVLFLPYDGQVVLASLWQRTLAMLIDLALLLLLSWTSWRIFLACFGLAWTYGSTEVLSDSLVDIEWGIRSGNLSSVLSALRDSQINWLSVPFDIFHSDFFGILIGSTLPWCIAKIYLEGRFGFTPGKWICGIRTVRTTLRSCGFARALVRNALYCADFPFLLTPISAVISLVVSDCNQRLGDRVADTIVIRSGAMKDLHTARDS